MKQLIIGFGHKRYSGKDTSAKMAVEFLSEKGPHGGVVHYAWRTWYADALKQAAMAAFDFSVEQVYGDLKGVVDPRWGFTPGWALQKMGTEAMRGTFGDDFWIRRLKLEVDQTDRHIMIADVRFPNEVAAIKSWGGFVVDVVRPDVPSIEDGRDAAHASETALDLYANWDGVILNDGSLDDLRGDVEVLVDRFLHMLATREREEAP
jgi:hypothetical protein